ncbi:MAG: hypothetical protein ACE5H8_06760 [Alphaproteobacteria bacterium]
MLQFAFEPVKAEVANPTTRVRFVEVARALRRLGAAADLLRDSESSELLIWGRRDWGFDIDGLRRRHRRVVFDFTDNILVYPHPTCDLRRRLRALEWRLKDRDRIRRFIARFDAVVVGSRWLAERVRAAYAGPVYIIEDGQPAVERVRPRARRADAVWVGMNNNIEYLFEVFGGGGDFADVGLKVVTARWKSRPYRGTRSNEALAARLPFRARFVEWRLESYLEEIAGCRVGLAPLPLNEVTLAKTENKLVLYSALGLPFLCSDIPAYRGYVERHGLGRVCRDREDWLSGLREFTADRPLRAAIARRGPAVVARHYAMEVIARKYLALYEDLMGSGCRAGG